MTRTSPAAALVLGLALFAQLALGVDYISRTAMQSGDERIYVLWDDAMISMRYARNLAEGHGLVWNPGEAPVQGYTNLGLTLAMAALHALPVTREVASLWVQLMALAALAATALLAARLVRDVSGDSWAGAGAALALLVCSPHQIYALQGSDTSFVALLLVASQAVLARSWLRDRRWSLWGFAPLLAAAAVRPDASLFVVSATALLIAFPDARGRATAALPIAGLLALWACLVAFSVAYYGDPLPNTYYLKATGMPRLQMWASGFDQIGFVGLGLAPSLALALAAFLGIRREPFEGHAAPVMPVLWLLAGPVVLATAYHVWVGGDWIREYGSRHLVQVLPTLFALAAIGAAWVAKRFAQRAAGVSALALVCGAALNPAWPAREWFVRQTPTLFHAQNQMNFMRSRFLERTTRPDTRIAVHWGGVGPYFADRPSLDLLGRSDRHIAHTRADRFMPGHSKWDWDYVLEVQKPDLIDFESRDLRHHPRFRSDYLVLRVGPQADLFIRRDAVEKLLDPDLEILPLEAHFGPLPSPSH